MDSLKVGDLVLMKKEDWSHVQWPLGRVTTLYPGADGILSGVEVKVRGELFKRAVSQLCPLPIEN